ncbi:4-hydroxyphenylpyruvate dioxygenase [Polymorphospora rubra]|uniref:4-hydroxyphenylpyruvate dioxygenase n=1 Tax=Polymorphospora rubra TaxID=338584 RepID=A0A810NBM9_9ACTN|nr:4-hydroxyphenylpyruvate dioxygenase [Polymorphospora rubra]BCJ69499.1 4-hydroxyphenylpyruvate dioxygenase [Polymorphospora rubra]
MTADREESAMTVQDIAYTELYTDDHAGAVDQFSSALGFLPVAESRDDTSTSTLLRQGDVKIVVTSGDAVAPFVDRHGAGIADIALSCDDVTATYTAALAAGATVAPKRFGVPAMAGFGEVVHSLVPTTATAPDARPAGRRWIALPPDAPGTEGPARLLDHVAICLPGGTLDEYADRYTATLGLTRYSSAYVAVGEQGMDSIVVRSGSGRVIFTLVAPDPAKQPGQLDRFLERNVGPGVQHLAFLVDDIITAVGDYGQRGVEFLTTPASYYDALADRLPAKAGHVDRLRGAQVLADIDEWGYLLQRFTRSPYERNTLFFELIQRQGSRGFGSANIRALYEAVERDRLTTP